MAPHIADNENAPDLHEWLRSIPGIPADFPRGILTPDEEEDL